MLIKRVGPLSLGKTLGILYAFIGFIVGFFFSIFSMIAAIFGTAMRDSPGPIGGAIFGIGAIVAFPIFYGVFGFIGGLITGGLYNVISKWVGGIEVELEEKPAA